MAMSFGSNSRLLLDRPVTLRGQTKPPAGGLVEHLMEDQPGEAYLMSLAYEAPLGELAPPATGSALRPAMDTELRKKGVQAGEPGAGPRHAQDPFPIAGKLQIGIEPMAAPYHPGADE